MVISQYPKNIAKTDVEEFNVYVFFQFYGFGAYKLEGGMLYVHHAQPLKSVGTINSMGHAGTVFREVSVWLG